MRSKNGKKKLYTNSSFLVISQKHVLEAFKYVVLHDYKLQFSTNIPIFQPTVIDKLYLLDFLSKLILLPCIRQDLLKKLLLKLIMRRSKRLKTASHMKNLLVTENKHQAS